MKQRDDEWRSIRVGRITGSRADALMAVTQAGKPTARREELIAQLVAERNAGQPFETATTFAMRRGSELEDEALGAYQMATGVPVVEKPFVVMDGLPWVGCSPDGLAADDGLVEIKCPLNAAKHVAALRFGTHADEYRWQVQHQMMVTGREWCDVVSYHPQFAQNCRLAIKRVERNAEAIEELRASIIQANSEIDGILAEIGKAAA